MHSESFDPSKVVVADCNIKSRRRKKENFTSLLLLFFIKPLLFYLYSIFNRPGVAGAVLQTRLTFIDEFIIR